MKTAITFLALAASASAFTTSSSPRSATTAVQASMDDMVGSIDARVIPFKFDPVSWCSHS